MSISRIQLVPATGLLSSYRKKSNPLERWPIEALKSGAFCTPDMLAALLVLNELVRGQQGTLFITDLFRPWELQEERRNDYLSGKKPAYAAAPGGSFHQAGRAVDFSTSELNFKDVPKENWVKKFWDLAIPLGFHPIIKIPDLRKSEVWHYDFPGKDWEKAYDYKDKSSSDTIDYTLVAKATILDVGCWPEDKENLDKTLKQFLQSQLIRLGHYEIGSIDGVIGKKTLVALEKLGISKEESLLTIASELSKL